MQDVFVIALTGATGSGKSTVAKHLVETYGFTRISIAQPLKEIVQRAFSLTDEQVFGDFAAKEETDPRYGVSPRWLLQHIATEGIRTVLGENFWIDLAVEKILASDVGFVVIDDLRFLNEARRIFSLSRFSVSRASNPLSGRDVHSAIFRLAGAQQGSAEYQEHPSEAEQRSPKFTALVRDTVTAPRSPNGRLLIEAFEEALARYAKGLDPVAQLRFASLLSTPRARNIP